MLYRIYQDTIKLTKEMIKFYELKYLITQEELKKPELFRVSHEENQ